MCERAGVQPITDLCFSQRLQEEVQQLKQQVEEERAISAALRRKLGLEHGNEVLPLQTRERSSSVTTDTSSTNTNEDPSDFSGSAFSSNASALSSSTSAFSSSVDERKEKKRRKKEKHLDAKVRARAASTGESPPKSNSALKKLITVL